MSDLGVIIKRYRKKADLTAKELALKIGVSQGAISHIETGKRNPSREMLQEIQAALLIPSEILQIEKHSEASSKKKNGVDHVLLTTKIGVTDLSFKISTHLANDIDTESLSDEEKSNITRSHAFETDIIVKTISEFLGSNEEKMKKQIMDELNLEVEKMRKYYSLEE